jgi:hypothetical protein
LWASVYLSARLFIHLQSLPFIFLNATTHRLAAADEKEGRALKRHGNFKEMWQIAKQIASQPLSDVCVDCTVKRCLDTRSVKSLNKLLMIGRPTLANYAYIIALHVCKHKFLANLSFRSMQFFALYNPHRVVEVKFGLII